MIELSWHGLYGDGWKNEIVADAFTHPAKYSRALIRHIYEYLMQEGMIHAGDIVLDPFGGVALGGLDAMRLGLNWVGVELEPKFVALGSANIELWNKRYAGKMPRWGTARLLQGDSRRLRDVIAQAECAVSSPPYAEVHKAMESPGGIVDTNRKDLAKYLWTKGNSGSTPGNLGNLPEGDYQAAISSPPFSQPQTRDRSPVQDGSVSDFMQRAYTVDKQGTTDGNLASMEMKDIKAAISSPPYAESISHDAGGNHKETYVNHYGGGDVPPRCYSDNPANLGNMRGGGYDAAVSSPAFPDGGMGDDRKNGGIKDASFREGRTGQVSGTHYGSTSGQMGEMKAAVSSPPYEASIHTGLDDDSARKRKAERYERGEFECKRPDVFSSSKNVGAAGMFQSNYGNSDGQIGAERGDDFWSAAKQVVSETYAVLAPGAVAVWVVKNFVRNKAVVPFCDQWQALCEACGFETIAIAKAWLVEEYGTQTAMDGNHKRKNIARKSFFRRLAESKGSPRIDWETVLIMKKKNVIPEAMK